MITLQVDLIDVELNVSNPSNLIVVEDVPVALEVTKPLTEVSLTPSVVELTLDHANVYDTFKGDYEVTPSREAQLLKCKNKVMSKDVTITEIPFFQVSNLSGGTTFFIAKEV